MADRTPLEAALEHAKAADTILALTKGLDRPNAAMAAAEAQAHAMTSLAFAALAAHEDD